MGVCCAIIYLSNPWVNCVSLGHFWILLLLDSTALVDLYDMEAEGMPYRCFLKAKRYIVKQFHSLIKEPVLRGCWIKPKGLAKKKSIIAAALIG